MTTPLHVSATILERLRFGALGVVGTVFPANGGLQRASYLPASEGMLEAVLAPYCRALEGERAANLLPVYSFTVVRCDERVLNVQHGKQAAIGFARELHCDDVNLPESVIGHAREQLLQVFPCAQFTVTIGGVLYSERSAERAGQRRDSIGLLFFADCTNPQHFRENVDPALQFLSIDELCDKEYKGWSAIVYHLLLDKVLAVAA